MDERYIDVSYDEDNGLRLIDAIKAVRRRFLVCLLAGFVTAGVFLLYTILRMDPQYQSSFTVYVSNRPASMEVLEDESLGFLNIGDVQASLSLAKTYAYIFESREIAQSAVKATGLGNYEGRAKRQGLISTSVEQETPLVTVTITADSPEDAHELSEAILDLIPSRTAMLPDGSSMTVVEPPQVPTGPSSPRKGLNAAIGFVLGFGIVALVEVVRGDKDKLVGDKDELEGHFGVPVFVDVQDTLPMVPQSAVRVVGITDARDGSQAAADAMALAGSYAASGARVLLIDTDTGSTVCRKELGASRTIGLSSILAGDAVASDAIQRLTGKGVDFLDSGRRTADYSRKVGGKQMDALLADFEKEYDRVVIAIPSVLSDGGGLALLDKADRALLSVHAGKTRMPDVAEALRRLNLVGARIDGFMFSKPQNPAVRAIRVVRMIARKG